MILADCEIRKALEAGHLIINPTPDESQFSPSALDLHLGQEIGLIPFDRSCTKSP